MSSTRQLAAIMFTDIVGYTDMMQTDEQKALAVIKHYNATLEKWVTHHGGRVANYYGDGSLCIFKPWKTPSLQDHVEFTPQVSIGINSGEMISGNIGSSTLRRLDYTVIGDTVNTAQ